MRELTAEGRAAQEKAQPAPARIPPQNFDLYHSAGAICIHGILLAEDCAACARWGNDPRRDGDGDLL